MQKLCLKLLRHLSSKIVKQSSEVRQISHTQKLGILARVTQKMKLKLKPSILITDDNNIKKKFTAEEKKELGLFIPRSPFNTRLTRNLQQRYLPQITMNLYIQQKEKLQSRIRILQNNLFLQKSKASLDHYINAIYKDIYARYLIAKSAGVQWQGYLANTGVVNPKNTSQYDSFERYKENYSILLDFIQNNVHLIQQSDTIGLYSYYQNKFVHPNVAEVQKIKRMGHYIKEQLTSYGKYEQQFNVLKEKNSKVYLLIMVEKLEKLINPNAICINQNDKYLMLKQFISDDDAGASYLIVSAEAFKQHQKYFKDNKYQKHNSFDGKYLLGMKCMNIPMIQQIQGYNRSPNAYIVNSHCHIGDFERVQAHRLPHFPSFIDQHGHITLKRSNMMLLENKKVDKKFKKNQSENKAYKESYVVVDQDLHWHLLDNYKIEKSLQKALVEQGINFMDFYQITDDQIYYHQKTKQMLHFRMGKKYSIQIPQNNVQQILKGFEKEKTIISQSKIKIQSINPGKKPRQKRQFRKQRKEKLQQITQHFNLFQSLLQISNIGISSLSQNIFKVPIFVNNGKIVPYQHIFDYNQVELLNEGRISQINLASRLGNECKIIYANQQLVKALIYMRNLHKNKEIHNVIIEPQSQTEQLIPNAIHLNYLINKSKARGRKFNSQVKNSISLIKLHPTLSESVKSIQIKDLIEGAIKSNDKQQYGLGFEALRLWTASNDNYLGDRSIKDQDINKELQHSNNIRTVFWNLLSIIPDQIKEVKPQMYISNFILDLIDCYICNMEECYKTLNIHQAYKLTNEFFTSILNEIYVKNIRERIINYPNLTENQEHFFIIRRILELVSVISPLFPFTAYHISKKADLNWPTILNPKFYENIPLHTEMMKNRVKLINKLRLNRLQYAQIYCESLKQPFSARDLQLFFNVKKVSFQKPDIEDRACSIQLNKNNSITDSQKLVIYSSDDYCLRCEPKSKQTEHLCRSCIDYLQEQIQQPLIYFRQRQLRKIQ